MAESTFRGVVYRVTHPDYEDLDKTIEVGREHPGRFNPRGTRCHEVALVARRDGYEATRFPSSTGCGVNLAILSDSGIGTWQQLTVLDIRVAPHVEFGHHTRKGAMNVSLPKELERFANDKVKSGDFASLSEVVRAGLRLLKEQDAEREARLEALRRDVGAGLEQLDRGEGSPGAAVFARLRANRKQRPAPQAGKRA